MTRVALPAWTPTRKKRIRLRSLKARRRVGLGAPTPIHGVGAAARCHPTALCPVVLSTLILASSCAPSVIRVASYNAQVLGRSKAAKPDVMHVVADIIRRYDVVAIQEIRDKSEIAPKMLLQLVNSDGSGYAMLLSPRTGQQPDDRRSQEQYAFYYRTETIEALDDGALYDDSEHDLFQREPFLAHFAAKDGSFTFVLGAIHTRPEAAVTEIGGLEHVFEWARAQYPHEDDVIIVGDYNAGCSYATPSELDDLVIRGPKYFWVVPDEADTNVADSVCAYDRIVFGIDTLPDFTGRWGVDRTARDRRVSDHWPVWAEFRR